MVIRSLIGRLVGPTLKVCKYCGKDFEYSSSAAKLHGDGGRLGPVCPACQRDFQSLKADLDVLASTAPGEAPWLRSAGGTLEVTCQRRRVDREAVQRLAVRLAQSMRSVSPSGAIVFSRIYSVFGVDDPDCFSSTADACSSIGESVSKLIDGIRNLDDEITISLHPSKAALLLSNEFGGSVRYRDSQFCYLIDTRHCVHSFYIYHR